MIDVRSFDGFAADYDRFASLEPPWLPQWLAHHLRPPGRRALDAGCGSGRHGWRQAVWLFGFRTSRSWLDHLVTDRYLPRPEFEERCRAEFPGARFEAIEDTHALIWHAPN
ncbi:hypothetical protein BH20ACT24_BH20ACT24_20540 [soil metagenome]